MKIITKPLGPVQANCYLLIENGHALMIDPGDTYPGLDLILKENESVLDAIVLTHAHFDHIGGVQWVCDTYKVDVYVNENEVDFLKNPDSNSSSSFMMDVYCDVTPKVLKEGNNRIGYFDAEAIYCPGHSIGSTVLKIKDNLFTGDVLFQGSIGRTDLYSGSQMMMMNSLKKLTQLDSDYPIYPGHGPSTSLKIEKKFNDYLIYAEKI